MTALPINIRPVTPQDAVAITAIYAHHVAHGTATFDLDAPGWEAWAEKIEQITARGWPFLVADHGAVVGYAYAAQLRDRPGYRYTCEDSIYVAPDQLGRGIGAALLGALIDGARTAGFREMIAVIGGAEPASIGVHARLGFAEVGRWHGVGNKFGRVLDVVHMQRALVTAKR